MAEKSLPTRGERKAKRDERRARQRAANVGRAAAMRDARLAWEAEARPAAAPAAVGPVHVGCSGWFYWHWRGVVYPDDLPTRDWFGHYADRLRTVELNAPFYSWPTAAAVRSWLRQAGRRTFVYTVKASELITHVKRFTGTRTLVKDFGHIADLLGPRMGCFLFQLPPSFRFSPARLRRILGQLDPARRNVVEFRHQSWWNEDTYAAYRMEDVLELYAEPHDPARPVVCFDECSKELHGQVADPIPVAPGRPAKEDYEYVRHGTANLFVIVEPLAGRRQVSVTERRAIPDFAAQVKYLCDQMYPNAAVIRVVLDNLNTHALGSLFATYPPDEAWRLARRLEFHYTPKHASWLNTAECELSVLSRQCLDRRIPDRATLATEVAAWQETRNRAEVKIEWTFRVADARKKLAFLYPKELVR